MACVDPATVVCCGSAPAGTAWSTPIPAPRSCDGCLVALGPTRPRHPHRPITIARALVPRLRSIRLLSGPAGHGWPMLPAARAGPHRTLIHSDVSGLAIRPMSARRGWGHQHRWPSHGAAARSVGRPPCQPRQCSMRRCANPASAEGLQASDRRRALARHRRGRGEHRAGRAGSPGPGPATSERGRRRQFSAARASSTAPLAAAGLDHRRCRASTGIRRGRSMRQLKEYRTQHDGRHATVEPQPRRRLAPTLRPTMRRSHVAEDGCSSTSTGTACRVDADRRGRQGQVCVALGAVELHLCQRAGADRGGRRRPPGAAVPSAACRS